MTPLFRAALDLQNFFTHRQWRFCIIGGIALLRWGEPRYTRDIDVTLLAGFGNEDAFIAPILSSGYQGRISDAAQFARKNRVLLVESPEHIPIDIALRIGIRGCRRRSSVVIRFRGGLCPRNLLC